MKEEVTRFIDSIEGFGNLIVSKPDGTVEKHGFKNTITKHFCPSCGSQVYTENTKAPNRLGVRVGLIEDASWFEPKVNVYTSRRLPSTPIDPKIKAFDKMPG